MLPSRLVLLPNLATIKQLSPFNADLHSSGRQEAPHRSQFLRANHYRLSVRAPLAVSLAASTDILNKGWFGRKASAREASALLNYQGEICVQ
jgi:hypothetical protein